MKLESLFKKSIKLLLENKVQFALAGGFAAGTYRQEHRFTNDIDFLISANGNERKVAENIISEIGLKPSLARKADFEGGPLFAIKRKNTPVWAVIGRDPDNQALCGLDFLLPAIPWLEDAVLNAQNNQLTYAGETVPTITVEDLIVAKLFSLKNNSTRFKDLDDLKSIFLAENEINIPYLAGKMQQHSLLIPKELDQFCPEQLKSITRLVKKL